MHVYNYVRLVCCMWSVLLETLVKVLRSFDDTLISIVISELCVYNRKKLRFT